MPGLPFYHLRDADALEFGPRRNPSLFPRVSSRTSEIQRMPLHQVAVTNYLDNAIIEAPEDLNRNRNTAPRFINNNNNVGPANRFYSQLTAELHGSADSEHDLAAMVHDFMENGSYGSDFPESSDGENGLTNGPKLFETLQAVKSNPSPAEKELLAALTKISLSIKEIDLVCNKNSTECNGGCIRRLLVKHLRLAGYDAAICSSKWSNSGKVPGGEYEYIDVCYSETNQFGVDRLIVDIDFLSQFEIARPTHSYATALKLLPVIFAGSSDKFKEVVQVMAEAAKLSLKQNSMPLPPWRTFEYMSAKWMSPYERISVDNTEVGMHRESLIRQWRERTRTKQCVEQLRHLKMCIAAENEKYHITPSDRNRGIYFSKTRRLSSGSICPL